MLARPKRVARPAVALERGRLGPGPHVWPAGILRLAVAGEVDHMRRGVDRGEELRDAHAQVAVHPVGDHLC